MLWTMRIHHLQRGIFKFPYLDIYKNSKGTCKVCDLCYMVIVAEQQLIEVQKLFALSLNIPIDDES